jgi:hypothetical protein
MIRRMGLDVTKHVPARRAAQELSEPLESNRLGSRVAQGAHGVVYTRPWVVEFVLDLAGYDPKENLVDAVVVEPCCGSGEFLEPLVRRLSES